MEKGRYSSSIDLIYDKAVRFLPAVIYILLIRVGYMFIISDQSLKTVVKDFIHMLYESLGLYSIGISPEFYLVSYLWYIGVLILVLALLTEFKFICKKHFVSLFLVFIIIIGYSHIFGTYTDLSDFRGIVRGDIFIKGVWRGFADCAVGALVRYYLPNIVKFINKIRSGSIIVFEAILLATLYIIIFSNIIPDSNILIVPISVSIISLCYANRGVLCKLLGSQPFSVLGTYSLELYLSQYVTFQIMVYMIPKVLKYGLKEFNLLIFACWMIVAFIVAVLFKLTLKYFTKFLVILIFKSQSKNNSEVD